MHPVRGIADQGEALLDDPGGMVEVERIAHPRGGQFDPPEQPVKPRGHFADKHRIG